MAAPMIAMNLQRALSKFVQRSPRVWIRSRLLSNESSNSSDSGNNPISDETSGEVSKDERKLTGFAEAFVRHAQVSDADVSAEMPVTVSDSHIEQLCADETVPFAEIFRNSSHVHLGAAHNQIVYGKIFHVVEDDLYIDFGGKFHCVCKKPTENPEKYHQGAKVRLRLKDLELTDHFVGASRDLTLLEADAELLGLAKQK